MKIGIPKEVTPGETRVAIVPETVKKLAKKGLEFVVEPGAGLASHNSDQDYIAAGAKVDPSVWGSDVVIKIHRPEKGEIQKLGQGSTLVCLAFPLINADVVEGVAGRGASLVAVDMIPRTTLAQAMDVLSSQATAAGYRAVLIAAESLPKFFPMLITAAGTILPSTVLILGAGVAGLQAIATSRRLGAVVEAFDVRKVVREQVESLGAKFVVVDDKEDAQGEGGYAKETSEEYQRRQREVIKERLARADICITTALIPGKKAPILITEDMLKAMRPGSIVIDMAAEQGGNCEATKAGQEVMRNGVKVLGPLNLPAGMPYHASQMYSRNMEKLLLHLLDKEAKAFKWDFKEEIAKGCVIVHGGKVVHEKLQGAATAAKAAN